MNAVRTCLAVLLALMSFGMRAEESASTQDAADALHRATLSRASAATRTFIEDRARKLPPGPYENANGAWTSFVASMAGSGGAIDPNALVQLVLRESYLQTVQDLEYYAAKVKYFNTAKKLVREYLASLRELDSQMRAKHTSDRCDAPLCARSATDLATLATALSNAGITQVILSELTTVGDARRLAPQLDAASKRLENEAAKDDEAAKAARAHRDHLLEAMRDYLTKVSQIKGTF